MKYGDKEKKTKNKIMSDRGGTHFLDGRIVGLASSPSPPGPRKTLDWPVNRVPSVSCII